MRVNKLREVRIVRNFTRYAEGSVLIEMGNTKVLCNASIVNGVPRFLKDLNQGWITAEYGMLPRATHSRGEREAAKGKQSGRTQEIQRLVGRALRSTTDLQALGEVTIVCDCDVLQADGGTRTASITGASIALIDAVSKLGGNFGEVNFPVKNLVAAVSVGIQSNGEIWLDLNYQEDSSIGADLNVVMLDNGDLVEIQGAAEHHVFGRKIFNQALDVAELGIKELIKYQKESLSL